MKEKDKQEYLERYRQEKESGAPFFPDVLFKDAVVALLVFLGLVALAYFAGAPLEARADPADTEYTPRPEWYFLFLFQLLKYFPGNLEVIGVIVIPALAILALLALPFLDRSARRHFLGRPVVIGIAVVSVIGVIFLTLLSVVEAPPPSEAKVGDPTAALYAENCAPCHGSSIAVPAGANLHSIIALGKHEDMPAWNADLTTDEIDALAGFIQSPGGSQLFATSCGSCHEVQELVAGNPLELKRTLDEGPDFLPHQEVGVPRWSETLSQTERTALLNFLAAPDGQRLFAINCASCHGTSVGFVGEESELRDIIALGGLHLEMPPWRDRLAETELEVLSRYVVDPASTSAGQALFQQHCASCHGQRVPQAEDFTQARQIIESGGSHETMPVWGAILTQEQLIALATYTLRSATGVPLELGQRLYSQSCASCHGDFGEGGSNPARPGDIIAPISSEEYLKTRDDATLRSIIAQGQPNFGMSPFGSAFGGPLDDEEIDTLVAYLRSWEANPPVELPPELASTPLPLAGSDIFLSVCAQCHGSRGEGLLGPALDDPAFQDRNSDQQIFDTISLGHDATSMVSWGEILTSEQINQLVSFIRTLSSEESATPSGPVSFKTDVLPIFQAACGACHGTLGGWDASSYETVMNTGDNAPVVIPGDAQGSPLGQWLLGTRPDGRTMPPSTKLPSGEIQLILDWIAEGALDN